MIIRDNYPPKDMDICTHLFHAFCVAEYSFPFCFVQSYLLLVLTMPSYPSIQNHPASLPRKKWYFKSTNVHRNEIRKYNMIIRDNYPTNNGYIWIMDVSIFR